MTDNACESHKKRDRNGTNTITDSYTKAVRESLLPLGIEAAWKLQQWDTLDEFLQLGVGVETSRNSNNCTSDSSNYSSIGRGEAGMPVLLGSLMSSLHTGRDEQFQHFVGEARQVVMASLSATSHESYKRSYSSLMQLHVLRELEYGYSLLHGDSNSSISSMNTGTGTVSDGKCDTGINTKYPSQPGMEGAASRIQSSSGCLWNERLSVMATPRKQRSSVLAIRRNIFAMCGRRDLVAGIWFDICTSYMQGSGLSESSGGGGSSAVTQHHECARMALRNSERFGMDREAVLFKESQLLKDMNRVTEALMLLDPVEIDISAIRSLFKRYNAHNDRSGSNKQVTLPVGLQTPEERRKYSDKILLSTKWMVHTKQKHGRPIMERFKLITEFNPKTSDGFFEYARYLEYLYTDALEKEVLTATANGINSSNGSGSGSGSGSGVSMAYEDVHDLSPQYAVLSLELFGKCLQFGSHDISAPNDKNMANTNTNANGESESESESKQQKSSQSQRILLQAMPRMLTIWLAFTSRREEVGGGGAKDKRGIDIHTPTLKWIEKANGRMARVVKLVTPAAWYSCMTQLVSRCADRNANPRTLEIISQILIIVVQEYPQASIWHIAGLFHSLNQDRRDVGDIILNEVKSVLVQKYQEAKLVKAKNTGQQGLERHYKNMATMIQNSPVLFQSFVELAQLQPKDPNGSNNPVKSFKWQVDKSLASSTLLAQFLVPLQSCLAMSNIRGHPAHAVDSAAGGLTGGVVDTVLSSVPGEYIHSFVETVEVAVSKAKPKTFTVITTSGKFIKFLCKQEKHGDLRMDARMMEFNGVVNRILACDAESRRRDLKFSRTGF